MQAKKIVSKFKQLRVEGKKAFAVLIDPDKVDFETLPTLLSLSTTHHVDFFFVGGSLITNHIIEELIKVIHQYTTIPVLLFPGNSLHVHPSADAILFLSLISGRNPEFLIGQQIVAAPLLKKSGIEILPTGYMLVDSGKQTTVSYISNTTPIPYDKPTVAACTAMAGEMLGLQLMYMDAGSGAAKTVSKEMVSAVRQAVDCPIIIGGGIKSAQQAYDLLQAGADVLVVGNGIEENIHLLEEIAQEVIQANTEIIDH